MSEEPLKPPTPGQAFFFKSIAVATFLGVVLGCYFTLGPMWTLWLSLMMGCGYLLKMMDRFHLILDRNEYIRQLELQLDREISVRRVAMQDSLEIVLQILARYYPYAYRNCNFTVCLPTFAVSIPANDRLRAVFSRPTSRSINVPVYTGEEIYVKLGELVRSPAVINLDWLDALVDVTYDDNLAVRDTDQARAINGMGLRDLQLVAYRHRLASRTGELVDLLGQPTSVSIANG